jgi:CheY-like chemotaxis protein
MNRISTKTTERPKLLWVDDEYADFPDLVTKLESNGWDVDCAESYSEALSKLAIGDVNSIIIDMIIPYGTPSDSGPSAVVRDRKEYLGFALLKALQKQRSRTSKQEIVVLSVVDEETLAVRIMRLVQEGVVKKQLVKRAGLALDDVVRAIGAPPSEGTNVSTNTNALG